MKKFIKKTPREIHGGKPGGISGRIPGTTAEMGNSLRYCYMDSSEGTLGAIPGRNVAGISWVIFLRRNFEEEPLRNQ